MLKQILKTVAIGAATVTALSVKTQAQSADALIEKLVDKGILTEKEAGELRDESDKDFTTAFQTKTGMPDWVSGYKFYGDFKGRFEENNSANTQYDTRDRYRYRLRAGVTISMVDNFETGFRLGSGNPLSNPGGVIVGGSSVSQSQDANSLFDANYLWIDTAYGKWTAINSGSWTLSVIIGKMDNPFQLSNMVWDYDIDPVGGAFVLQHQFNDQQTIKGIGAMYVLDEFNQGFPSGNQIPTIAGHTPQSTPSQDPYLYGGQILWQSQWTPKISTSLGLAAFDIVNKESLNGFVQPLYNVGNTRNSEGFLAYNFNPIIASASATYCLSAFPLYHGVFPLTLAGEYMNNPGAPANNEGYRFGFTLGKAGTKHTWQISYRYQQLDADAWYDALVDDDNGSYYAATAGTYVAPTSNKGASGQAGGQLAWINSNGKAFNNGWYGGTNQRGHLIQATYSLTDFLDLSVIFYLNSLVIQTPNESSDAQHFMVDLAWRF